MSSLCFHIESATSSKGSFLRRKRGDSTALVQWKRRNGTQCSSSSSIGNCPNFRCLSRRVQILAELPLHPNLFVPAHVKISGFTFSLCTGSPKARTFATTRAPLELQQAAVLTPIGPISSSRHYDYFQTFGDTAPWTVSFPCKSC